MSVDEIEQKKRRLELDIIEEELYQKRLLNYEKATNLNLPAEIIIFINGNEEVIENSAATAYKQHKIFDVNKNEEADLLGNNVIEAGI